MKKVILAVICLSMIISCDFEIPKSLTVKGNPGLYVPLGSPFAGMKEEDRLEYLISSDNVKKMMNDKKTEAGLYDDLKIYEVDGELATALGIDPDVQTYLVRYPMAEMPLELEEYADKAMDAVNDEKQFTIPDVPALPAKPTYLIENGLVETSEDDDHPFIRIPLQDMAKLVKSVERSTIGIFGLEINYDPQLADHLELKIPGLGFDWMTGIPTDDNGTLTNTNPTKLRYYNAAKVNFYPRVQKDASGNQLAASDLAIDGNLLVYARISDTFQKQTLTPLMIFDWEKATIDTTTTDSKGSFTGEYSIKNNLSDFLGEKVSFKRVEGYMYMSGVHVDTASTSTMTINIDDVDRTYPLEDVNAPGFPDGGIFNLSYGDILLKHNNKYDMMSLDEPIDMGEALNSNSKNLKVAITINGVEIERNKLENMDKTHIQFDLLVLIPLDLVVANEITDPEIDSDIRDNYVMLDLGDMLKKGTGDGDLFGRKEGEDNALKYLSYVTIGLKFSKSDINIIDPTMLAVLVTTNSDSRLLQFKNNASLRFTGPDLNKIPFSPEFTVLLEKDTPGTGNSGSFKILRPKKPSFDFRLYVEAKAALEYTLEF